MAGDRRIVTALLTAAIAVGGGCAQVRKVGDGEDARKSESGGDREKPSSASAPKRPPGQPAREGKPPLPATPSGLVTESAARQIKQELHKRGFLENPSPGPQLDARTSDALRRFQQSERLAATGFPDQETLRRLNVSAEDALQKKID